MTKSVINLLVLGALTAWVARAADAPNAEPPKFVGPVDAEHAATNRAFQGIPSLAVAPKGRLWAVWYGGVTPGEDRNNYAILSTSGDGGAHWTETLVIDPDGGGELRAFDPELWVAPDGRLFAFWAQTFGHDGKASGVWCLETTEPDAAQPKWSAPRRLTDGVMMCKPLVLSSGEWVLPVSTWRETDNSARFVVSQDAGKTWTVRGGCNVPVEARNFDEHSFVERRDGSLWLLVRTKYGIGESLSTDHGRTWPELKPSKIMHTSSRFFVRRLNSGNLLLVKHGPIDQITKRCQLMAFVSKDDGQTWGGGLLLDERLGVSYPDGQQTADGLIRVIYDFNRQADRNILLATFREEDAAAGKPVSDAVRLAQVVSQASGGQAKTAAPKTTAAKADPAKMAIKDNADGVPLRTTQPGALGLGDLKPVALALKANLFADRKYTVNELPEALKKAQFLPISMDDAKTLTCQRAGTVWFFTPNPDRNHDSQTKTLLGQGFQKVALPEVRLFAPSNPANFCSLYQKDCQAGETIQLGKWAVPVFLP